MRSLPSLVLAAAATTLLASASTIAGAADLPSRRAPPAFVPPPPIPVFTWSGIYIGGNAGYAFGARDAGNNFDLPNGSVVNSGGTDGTLTLGSNGGRNGFTGGGQVGFNYELGSGQNLPIFGSLGLGNLGLDTIGGLGGGLAGGLGGGLGGGAGHTGIVFGVEADAQYLGIGRRNLGTDYSFAGQPGLAFVPVVGAAPATVVVNGQPRRSDYFGTVRGRLGIAVDRVLVFGSGGFAYSDRTTGYAYGGGVEYGLTNNITIRAEYLRVELGHGGNGASTGTFDEGANVVTLNTALSNRESFNVVRGALNFKFNSLAPAAPVVARY